VLPLYTFRRHAPPVPYELYILQRYVLGGRAVLRIPKPRGRLSPARFSSVLQPILPTWNVPCALNIVDNYALLLLRRLENTPGVLAMALIGCMEDYSSGVRRAALKCAYSRYWLFTIAKEPFKIPSDVLHWHELNARVLFSVYSLCPSLLLQPMRSLS
jgi:hypothetical protein